MKTYKFEVEFALSNDFSDERLRKEVKKAADEIGFRSFEYLYELDKEVIVPEYPIMYYTNVLYFEVNDEDIIINPPALPEKIKYILDMLRDCGIMKISTSCIDDIKIECISAKEQQESIPIKVFVTGVAGKLGHDVIIELAKRGYHGIGSDIAPKYKGISNDSAINSMPYVGLDITDSSAVERILTEIKPDVIIHCAAWNAVDAAEKEENIVTVRETNANATRTIATVCKRIDAKMVYLSTDYVFSGEGYRLWSDDNDVIEPQNIYGKTKLEGEQAVASLLEKYFIVRTSWMFGINGDDFVKTMMSIGKRRGEIHVVNDQIGTPTYTLDLARLLVDMIGTKNYGYYNATNEGGYVSWYDFTIEIFKLAGIDAAVIPVSTKEYGLSKAKRPLNSRLDKSKLVKAGFNPLPTWQDALNRYMNELEARRNK